MSPGRIATWRWELSGSPGPWVALGMVRALQAQDVELCRRASLPLLYDSGVRYRRDRVRAPNGLRVAAEVWRDAGAVLARGYGDCEDLATWRAAELRVRGVRALDDRGRYGVRGEAGWFDPAELRDEYRGARSIPAEAVLIRWKDVRGPGAHQYHVLTRIPGPEGSTWYDDPSQMLGMRDHA